MPKLVPDGIIALPLHCLLVVGDDVDKCLGVLLLLLLGDAVLLQHSLPFFRQSLEGVSLRDVDLRPLPSLSLGSRREDQRESEQGDVSKWGDNTHSVLAGLIVNTDMGDVHWICRCRYRRSSRRAEDAVHEARESTLLLEYLWSHRFADARLVRVSLPRTVGAAI